VDFQRFDLRATATAPTINSARLVTVVITRLFIDAPPSVNVSCSDLPGHPVTIFE
jgi:hypothetical protein